MLLAVILDILLCGVWRIEVPSNGIVDCLRGAAKMNHLIVDSN
jgi:hypothetical protein